MAVAYDSTGVGSSSFAPSLSWAHNASAGCYAIVAGAGSVPTTSATYDGAAMAGLGTNGYGAFFGLANVGGGSKTVVENNSYAWVAAGSVAYTGVDSVGAMQTASGTGTSMSQTVSCSAGEVIVQAFFAPKTISSPSGGTNRYIGDIYGYASVCISDAASSATFTANLAASTQWYGIAVVLSPAAGVVVPVGAAVSLSGGVPPVVVSGPVTVAPAGATVSVSGGTPTVANMGADVAFDSAGTGYAGLWSAGVALTTPTITVVTAGATVYVDIFTDRATTLSAVTCGGSAMTLVDTVTFSSGVSGAAKLCRYKYEDCAAGAQAVSATSSVAVWGCLGVVAFTGVGSLGALQSATGSGYTATLSPTCNAGEWLLCAIGGYPSTGLGLNTLTVSGGTNRYNGRALSDKGYADLAVSDATVSGTTFTGVDGAHSMAEWGALAHALVPAPAAITVTPDAATLTITGDAPLVSGIAITVSPAGATLTVTGGTVIIAWVIVTVSPGAITVSLTAAAPQILLYPPDLSRVLEKLRTGQPAVIQVLGDSTSYGFGDDVTTPWPHGWVGRLGILLGQLYDVNVSIKQWNDQGSIPFGWPDSGATGQFYDATYSLYTSTQGGGAPTLLMVDGGACSRELTYLNDVTRLPIMLATPNIDAIITATGINDYGVDFDTPSQFAAAYDSWLTHIQTLCPGVPIIVTNQNVTNATYEANLVANFAALFTALAGRSGVKLLNTRLAYTDMGTMVQPVYTYAGVHPTAAGYTAQALSMLRELTFQFVPSGVTITATAGSAPPIGARLVAAPASITATGSTPEVIMPVVVRPVGATPALTGSVAGVIAPLTLSPGAAALALIGSTPIFPIVVSPGAGFPYTLPFGLGMGSAVVTITTSRASLDMSLLPAPRSLTLTGSSPATSNPVTVSPTAAMMTATLSFPIIAAPGTVVPASASLAVTGSSPLLASNYTVAATTASITASAGTPSVVVAIVVRPVGATMSVAGGVVILTNPATVVPAGATLAAVGGAPVIISPVQVSPAAATLTITAGTPVVACPVVVTPAGVIVTVTAGVLGVTVGNNQFAAPAGISVSVTGGVPGVACPVVVAPSGASADVSGGIPALTMPVGVSPSGAALTVAAGIPILVQPGIVVPAPAVLATSRVAALVDAPYTVSPAGAILTAGGGSAALVTPLLVSPLEATLTVSGAVVLLGTLIRPNPTVSAMAGGIGLVAAAYTVTPTGATLTPTGGIPGLTTAVAPTPADRIVVVAPENRTTTIGHENRVTIVVPDRTAALVTT